MGREYGDCRKDSDRIGEKEAQKQTDGTENDAAAQNAKRVFGDEPVELYARSAVLMDADSGRVLFGKDADVVRPMASTTKIMTCILALEYLREHPDQTIEVSDQAASTEGTSWDAERRRVLHQRPVVFPDLWNRIMTVQWLWQRALPEV